jgi:hypothetical protein
VTGLRSKTLDSSVSEKKEVKNVSKRTPILVFSLGF